MEEGEIFMSQLPKEKNIQQNIPEESVVSHLKMKRKAFFNLFIFALNSKGIKSIN